MDREPGNPSTALSRAAYLYLGTTSLSVIGTTFGLLGVTGATTEAGGGTRGGLYAGLFMATALITTALGTPYVPLLCARLGVRPTFVVAQTTNALAYLVAGVALLVGAPAMPILLIAAPVIGASTSVSTVVPLLSRSYQASDSTAHSYARLSVALGLAWGIGGLIGGVVLSRVTPEWGLVINALLTVPRLLVTSRIAPSIEPPAPEGVRQPWRSAYGRLRADRHLRWSVALGVTSVVFLAPIMTLVVPVTDSLRHSPAVTAAGLLIACFAIGELASPWAVRFATNRSADLRAGEVAGLLAGAMLFAFGAVSMLLEGRLELLAWVLIAVPFSVLRFAARALYVGAAADAGAPGDSAANLAAADTVVLLAAPVGVLLFGISVDLGAVHLPLFLSGLCAIASNLLAIRTLRSADAT